MVINLLNTQNVADKRVYEILSEKFELFQGVFGASDKAIGLLESGADFEKELHLYIRNVKQHQILQSNLRIWKRN